MALGYYAESAKKKVIREVNSVTPRFDLEGGGTRTKG